MHERIDPRSILEAVRKRNGGSAEQISLFSSPIENPPSREAIEFYKHAHNWSNRLIAGDSLLGLSFSPHPTFDLLGSGWRFQPRLREDRQRRLWYAPAPPLLWPLGRKECGQLPPPSAFSFYCGPPRWAGLEERRAMLLERWSKSSRRPC